MATEESSEIVDEESAPAQPSRFSRLPDRVRPTELIETVPADARSEEPQLPFDPRLHGYSQAV